MAVPWLPSADTGCSWPLATGRAVRCPKEGRKHLAGSPGQSPGKQALDIIFPGGVPASGLGDLF